MCNSSYVWCTRNRKSKHILYATYNEWKGGMKHCRLHGIGKQSHTLLSNNACLEVFHSSYPRAIYHQNRSMCLFLSSVEHFIYSECCGISTRTSMLVPVITHVIAARNRRFLNSISFYFSVKVNETKEKRNKHGLCCETVKTPSVNVK